MSGEHGERWGWIVPLLAFLALAALLALQSTINACGQYVFGADVWGETTPEKVGP